MQRSGREGSCDYAVACGHQVKVLSAALVLRPDAPHPLHVVQPMRLKLLEREEARLRDLVTRTADWLWDNAVEKGLQIETAVIEGDPKGSDHRGSRAVGGGSHRSRLPRLWAYKKVSAWLGLASRSGARTVFGRNRAAPPPR